MFPSVAAVQGYALSWAVYAKELREILGEDYERESLEPIADQLAIWLPQQELTTLRAVVGTTFSRFALLYKPKDKKALFISMAQEVGKILQEELLTFSRFPHVCVDRLAACLIPQNSYFAPTLKKAVQAPLQTQLQQIYDTFIEGKQSQENTSVDLWPTVDRLLPYFADAFSDQVPAQLEKTCTLLYEQYPKEAGYKELKNGGKLVAAIVHWGVRRWGGWKKSGEIIAELLEEKVTLQELLNSLIDPALVAFFILKFPQAWKKIEAQVAFWQKALQEANDPVVSVWAQVAFSFLQDPFAKMMEVQVLGERVDLPFKGQEKIAVAGIHYVVHRGGGWQKTLDQLDNLLEKKITCKELVQNETVGKTLSPLLEGEVVLWQQAMRPHLEPESTLDHALYALIEGILPFLEKQGLGFVTQTPLTLPPFLRGQLRTLLFRALKRATETLEKTLTILVEALIENKPVAQELLKHLFQEKWYAALPIPEKEAVQVAPLLENFLDQAFVKMHKESAVWVEGRYEKRKKISVHMPKAAEACGTAGKEWLIHWLAANGAFAAERVANLLSLPKEQQTALLPIIERGIAYLIENRSVQRFTEDYIEGFVLHVMEVITEKFTHNPQEDKRRERLQQVIQIAKIHLASVNEKRQAKDPFPSKTRGFFYYKDKLPILLNYWQVEKLPAPAPVQEAWTNCFIEVLGPMTLEALVGLITGPQALAGYCGIVLQAIKTQESALETAVPTEEGQEDVWVQALAKESGHFVQQFIELQPAFVAQHLLRYDQVRDHLGKSIAQGAVRYVDRESFLGVTDKIAQGLPTVLQGGVGSPIETQIDQLTELIEVQFYAACREKCHAWYRNIVSWLDAHLGKGHEVLYAKLKKVAAFMWRWCLGPLFWLLLLPFRLVAVWLFHKYAHYQARIRLEEIRAPEHQECLLQLVDTFI